MSAYLTYKLYKALALLAIVAIGAFLYGLFTGKTLGSGQTDKPQDPGDQGQP